MTATFILQRHEDPSGVSGTGDVAWGAEFPDGAVAVRWPGDHPSTATWGDIRDVEAIHGHNGKTTVTYDDDNARLVRAYRKVMPYVLEGGLNPVKVGPHADLPDRLQLVFMPGDEAGWRRWIALFEGSTFAAVHEERNGETEHRWVSPDGDLWLSYWTADLPAEELLAGERYPLETFDREDR